MIYFHLLRIKPSYSRWLRWNMLLIYTAVISCWTCVQRLTHLPIGIKTVCFTKRKSFAHCYCSFEPFLKVNCASIDTSFAHQPFTLRQTIVRHLLIRIFVPSCIFRFIPSLKFDACTNIQFSNIVLCLATYF